MGTDPGILAAYNGGTHMPFEDVGLMRNIPRCVVVEPADGVALKKLLPQIAYHPGSVYMRLNRKASPAVHSEGTEFSLGKANVVKDGTDVAIFATGCILVPEAVEAARLPGGRGDLGGRGGLPHDQADRPGDDPALRRSDGEDPHLREPPDRERPGLRGRGGALGEPPTLLARLGVNEQFGQVGDVEYLKKAYGLDAQTICDRTRQLLASPAGRK